jgi:hypothetical protein
MLASLREHYPDQDAATLERDLDAYLKQLEEFACAVRTEPGGAGGAGGGEGEEAPKP